MARSSPGVGRIVAILNFIADHPGQSFTLTDIVRALRLSRATCHGLLTGLVEAGYLYRASDKSYVLGPALIAMGKSASEHFSPLQVTQPEMRALADEYDALCAACFLDGTDVEVRDRAAGLSHIGTSQRGARLPLRPQFASVFFVGASPAEANDWLDRVDPAPAQALRDTMLRGIDVVRERGYGVTELTAPDAGAPPPAGQPVSRELLDTSMRPVFAIDPDADYLLSNVQAPVFDARRQVAFVLALSGFRGSYDGRGVEAIGRRLSETCNRISSFISRVRPAAGF